MLKELAEQIQYRINRLVAQGSGIQYLILVVISLLITALGMGAYFMGLFSPEALDADGISRDFGGGFWDTLWWSLKHVIDPGAFEADYRAPWQIVVVSLALSIAGLVIFGTLIGFIANFIKQRMDQIRRGNTPVKENGHTLILGWSQKAQSIIRIFGEMDAKHTVVVLAPHDTDQMKESLRLVHNRKQTDVVLRSGATSNLQELERVAASRAGSVIILAPDQGSAGSPDIDTIKTLMVLDTLPGHKGKLPNMVAEVTDKRNTEIAEIAGGHHIPVVSSAGVISRAIVQAAIKPGIAAVYLELLSSTENSIVVRSFPSLLGKTFGEIAHCFTGAMPLGICWLQAEKTGQRLAVALNPEHDDELDENEQLILLASDRQPVTSACLTDAAEILQVEPRTTSKQLARVIVLGWNRHAEEILAEFDAHSISGGTITVVSGRTGGTDPQTIGDSEQTFKNITVEYREGDPTSRTTLESLELDSCNSLILLADYSHLDRDPDARSIMSLLLLADIQKKRGRAMPHQVVEILDQRNRALVSGITQGDVVLSPEIVSMQLAQISQQQILGSIYRELLSAGGIELALRPADEYTATGSRTTFTELVAVAQSHAEVALGVCLKNADGAGGKIILNPAKDTTWTLDAADQVIVLAQEIYA